MNTIRRLLTIAILAAIPPLARSQIAVRIPDKDLDVQQITSINGELWLATTEGAYKTGLGGTFRIPNEDLVVNGVAPAGDSIWLATTDGAFRIAPQTTHKVPDEVLDVLTLAPISGSTICLGTATGAYLSDGSLVTAVGPPDGAVHSITVVEGTAWLATSIGAYRLSLGGKAQRLPIDTRFVNSISSHQGIIWVAAEQGAFRIDDKLLPTTYVPGINVLKVVEVGGVIWLATKKGAYRVTGTTAQRIPDVDLSVEDIVNIDGDVWLATNRGAYKLDNNTNIPLKIPDYDLAIKSVIKVGKNIWFAGYHGAFTSRAGQLKRIPDVDLDVQDMRVVDNSLWMATTKGAYRIEDLSVSLSLLPANSWGQYFIGKMTGQPLAIAGDFVVRAGYITSNGATAQSPELMRPSFRVIVESSESNLTSAIDDKKYSPLDTYVKTLSSGKQQVAVNIIDKWGNSATNSIDLWVLPGPLLVSFVVPSLWLAVLASVILLAPTWEVANDLLMNPWLRKIGSFGLIPLVLSSVPGIRKHVLKRYITALAEDPDINNWLENYEVPDRTFAAEAIGRRLSEKHAIQITGRSGIGKTSYLKYLTASYACKLSGARGRSSGLNQSSKPRIPVDLEPRAIVPVFVPLARYRGQKAEDMIYAQLSSYGSLNDKELAAWYLRQGGFLLLFDGLNELDDSTRNEINRFVDEARRRCFFCISSQEAYPTFVWIDEARLASLPPSSIANIVVSRLGEAKGASILTTFNQETYDLYKVPQDLELLIQILGQVEGAAVPQSKPELYAKVMSPVFAAWQAEGHADYRDSLIKRAFDMVSTRDPMFYAVGKLTLEFVGPLLNRKLVVERDGSYYFQHNLIRDYLASIWFRDKWPEVLVDSTSSIDSNWSEMLRLTLESLNQSALWRDYLGKLLIKNRDIAGNLLSWAEVSHREFVKDWSIEFKVRFAESVINDNGPSPLAVVEN